MISSLTKKPPRTKSSQSAFKHLSHHLPSPAALERPDRTPPHTSARLPRRARLSSAASARPRGRGGACRLRGCCRLSCRTFEGICSGKYGFCSFVLLLLLYAHFELKGQTAVDGTELEGDQACDGGEDSPL